MFTLIAATIFSIAALLALGTIGWMFTLYREKMVAALLFEPLPELRPVYAVRIRRPRLTQKSQATGRASALPGRMIAA